MLYILIPSAYIAGKAVHVAVPLDDWDAKCYAKVKGHLVWQCNSKWRTEVAEPAKPVQQVSELYVVGWLI